MVSVPERNLVSRVTAAMKQPLLANAGYLIGINLIASAVGFVFWKLATHLYQPEEVGTASAVLSAAVLVAEIARLGVDSGLVRFLPQARAPHRLLNTAFAFNAVSALFMGGVFLAGLSLWSPSLVGLQRNDLYVVGFLTYVTAETLGAVVRMTFVARRQAHYALIHTSLVNGGRLLLLVLLADLGAAGLVGSVALAVVLTVALSLSRFLPKVEPGYRLRLSLCWSDLAAIIPYSVGNYFAGLLTQATQTVLPIIVLEMMGPAPSGYTYIAWMLGGLLASPGLALAVSAFAEGSNSPQRLRAILLRSAALGLSLTVPAAAIVGLTAPWLLLLLGPNYAQGASGLLRWLTATAPLAVLTGLYSTYLRVRKQVGRLILVSSMVATITLGLGVALMPRWGIAASGIGWLAGNTLAAGLAIGSIWRDIVKDKREVHAMSLEKAFPPQESRPRVVAAIPCYNEARFVGSIVQRTRPHVDVVVVVDDGSTDGTDKVARAAGAQVVRHDTNLGPGAAARSCLQVGREMQAGVLVTLDGDGQHNPDEIPEVIAPVLSEEADLVIGSRFLGRYNNVARYRRFGINVITFLYNVGAQGQITDGQSCFRVYNQRALEALHITEPGFGFSVETLVQARNAGLRIREASISCVYHQESHSMNPVLHGVGVALMVVKHRALAILGTRNGKSVPLAGEETNV
jgi:O-antigen/teichoic acid export membrane protein